MGGRAMRPEYEELEQYMHQYFQWRYVESHRFGKVVTLFHNLFDRLGRPQIPDSYWNIKRNHWHKVWGITNVDDPAVNLPFGTLDKLEMWPIWVHNGNWYLDIPPQPLRIRIQNRQRLQGNNLQHAGYCQPVQEDSQEESSSGSVTAFSSHTSLTSLGSQQSGIDMPHFFNMDDFCGLEMAPTYPIHSPQLLAPSVNAMEANMTSQKAEDEQLTYGSERKLRFDYNHEPHNGAMPFANESTMASGYSGHWDPSAQEHFSALPLTYDAHEPLIEGQCQAPLEASGFYHQPTAGANHDSRDISYHSHGRSGFTYPHGSSRQPSGG